MVLFYLTVIAMVDKGVFTCSRMNKTTLQYRYRDFPFVSLG